MRSDRNGSPLNRPRKNMLINITESALRKQIEKLRRLGLMPSVEAAAESYGAGVFDAADLIAIGSRESNYADKYLRVAGDGGNGFGWLQADRRSFPEWIRTGEWKDAGKGFLMGAKILRSKLADTIECEGVRFTVTDKRGRVFTCPKGKRLTERERYRVALAAYNCGRWAHYHVSKNRDVDAGTTGKDYAIDVSLRAAFIRAELKRDVRATIAPHSFITAAVAPTIEEEPQALPRVNEATAAPPEPDGSPFPAAGNGSPDSLTFNDVKETVTTHVSKDSAMRVLKRAGVPTGSFLLTLWGAGVAGKVVLVVAGVIALCIAGYLVKRFFKQIKSAVVKAVKG